MFRTYHAVKAVPLLACLVGCSPAAGDAPNQNGTGSVPGAGGAPVAPGAGGAVGSGGAVSLGSGGHTLLDVGEDGTGGSPASLGTNGGYIDLSAEQVADIEGSQCDGDIATVEPIPPVLEFVVDVSNSMGQDVNGVDIALDDTTTQSKWEITQPAFKASLDALGDDVLVGMQFFPSNDSGIGGPGGGACVDATTAYPIAVLGPAGSTQRTTLATAIDTTPLKLGTPTEDAYTAGIQNLDAYTGPGNKFIVLVTDGAPSQTAGCGPLVNSVPPEPIVAAVAAAKADGVGTFVIGSPGSQTSMDTPPKDMRYWLSDAALAGGTAPDGCSSAGPNYCHLDMTTAPDFAAALSTALADIADAVVKTCSFAAPEDAGQLDLEATTVIFKKSDQTAVLVLPDADADCAAGGWTRGPNNEVVLCPATCDLVNADPGAQVSMSIGCNIIIK